MRSSRSSPTIFRNYIQGSPSFFLSFFWNHPSSVDLAALSGKWKLSAGLERVSLFVYDQLNRLLVGIKQVWVFEMTDYEDLLATIFFFLAIHIPKEHLSVD